MDKIKKVLFIANLKTPEDKMSSTDIMTTNIISGLSSLNIKLCLLVPENDSSQKKSVMNYYKKYTDNIIFVKRIFMNGQSPAFSVFGSLFYLLFKASYKRELKLNKLENDYDVIISNKITVDEIIYGHLIKKENAKSSYIQYWSDPMALAGTNLKDFYKKPKRWIFSLIESKCLKLADKIVYGTKTLLYPQQKFMKKYANKMSYIDIPYVPRELSDSFEYNKRLIYAGDYFSNVRNILPLIESIGAQDDFELDIFGNGDLNLEGYKNIFISNRIPKNQLDVVFGKYKFIVCLLNKDCTQIPGKVFYDIFSKQNIIVLVDGPLKDEIVKYLSDFKRFVLCENNVNSIRKLLSNLEYEEVNIKSLEEKFSPKAIAMGLLNGGN